MKCSQCGRKIKDWWPLVGKIRDVDITKMFGVPASTISRYRTRRGIPKVPKTPPKSFKMVEMYKAGASINSIASTMGCTPSNVSQIIKRYLCGTSTPKPADL